MNTNYKFRYPTAMTIAGSDSGGGAGIQADLKTFSALGVFGVSAITAITAQNTCGVRNIQAVSPDVLRGQIEAVWEDITVDALKIGMLHNKEAICIVAEEIDRFHPKWTVLDPVMISTSGSKLLEDETISHLIELLFKRADLITPNRDEAAFLTGITINNMQQMEEAGHHLLDMGCKAVLMKGGDMPDLENSNDLLMMRGEKPVLLATPKIATPNTHGTGCTLSSAITAYLALGDSLQDAVQKGKAYVTQALKEGYQIRVGKGHGPVNHFWNPQPLHKLDLSE